MRAQWCDAYIAFRIVVHCEHSRTSWNNHNILKQIQDMTVFLTKSIGIKSKIKDPSLAL